MAVIAWFFGFAAILMISALLLWPKPLRESTKLGIIASLLACFFGFAAVILISVALLGRFWGGVGSFGISVVVFVVAATIAGTRIKE